jgi:hypothetical protein
MGRRVTAGTLLSLSAALATGALPATVAGCGDSSGASCDLRPCSTSADCCDGLECRLPSEGILPVEPTLKCRSPAPAGL